MTAPFGPHPDPRPQPAIGNQFMVMGQRITIDCTLSRPPDQTHGMTIDELLGNDDEEVEG